MNDRLLSEQEIKQALQSYYEYALPTITAENRYLTKRNNRQWPPQGEDMY